MQDNYILLYNKRNVKLLNSKEIIKKKLTIKKSEFILNKFLTTTLDDNISEVCIICGDEFPQFQSADHWHFAGNFAGQQHK